MEVCNGQQQPPPSGVAAGAERRLWRDGLLNVGGDVEAGRAATAPQAKRRRCEPAEPAVSPANGEPVASLHDMPTELLLNVLVLANAGAVVSAGRTCHKLYGIARSDTLWRALFQRDFPYGAAPPVYHKDHARFGKDVRWLYAATASRPPRLGRRDPDSGRLVGSTESAEGVLISGEFGLGVAADGVTPMLVPDGYATCVEPLGGSGGAGGGVRVLEGRWCAGTFSGPGRCWEPGYVHIRCDRWDHALPNGSGTALYYDREAGYAFDINRTPGSTQPSGGATNVAGAGVAPQQQQSHAPRQHVGALSLAHAHSPENEDDDRDDLYDSDTDSDLDGLMDVDVGIESHASMSRSRPDDGIAGTSDSLVPPLRLTSSPDSPTRSHSIHGGGGGGVQQNKESAKARNHDRNRRQGGKRKRRQWTRNNVRWCQRYKGTFCHGLRCGFGALWWFEPDGPALYRGEWFDGERSGRGVLVDADGNAWSGQWDNGVLNGPAVRQTLDGHRVELRTDASADPRDDPHQQDHWLRIDASGWKVSRTPLPPPHSPPRQKGRRAEHNDGVQHAPPGAHAHVSRRVVPHRLHSPRTCTHIERDGCVSTYIGSGGAHARHESRDGTLLIVGSDLQREPPLLVAIGDAWSDKRIAGLRFFGIPWTRKSQSSLCSAKAGHKALPARETSLGAGCDASSETSHETPSETSASAIDSGDVSVDADTTPSEGTIIATTRIANGGAGGHEAASRKQSAAEWDWNEAKSKKHGIHDGALVWPADLRSHAARAWALYLASPQCAQHANKARTALRAMETAARSKGIDLSWTPADDAIVASMPVGAPFGRPLAVSADKRTWFGTAALFAQRPTLCPVSTPAAKSRPTASAPLATQGSDHCALDDRDNSQDRDAASPPAEEHRGKQPDENRNPTPSVFVRCFLSSDADHNLYPPESRLTTMASGVADEGQILRGLAPAAHCVLLASGRFYATEAAKRWLNTEPHGGFDPETGETLAVRLALPWRSWFARMPADLLCHTMRRASSRVAAGLLGAPPERAMPPPIAWRCAAIVTDDALRSATLSHLLSTRQIDPSARTGIGFVHSTIDAGQVDVAHAKTHIHQVVRGFDLARLAHMEFRHPQWDARGPWRFGAPSRRPDDPTMSPTSRDRDGAMGVDDAAIVVALTAPSFALAHLRGVFFFGQRFVGACFAGATLDRCAFVCCHFQDCVFIDTAVVDCGFYDCQIYDAHAAQWAPIDGAAVPLCATARCLL